MPTPFPGITTTQVLIRRRQIRRARARLRAEEVVYLTSLVKHARRESGIGARLKQLSLDFWSK